MSSTLLDAPSYESLTSPEFDAEAAAALARTVVRQRAFEAEWLPAGFKEWSCDQDAGVIRFTKADGTGLQGSVQILGSHHSRTGSWEWGWNNPHVNEAISRDARAVRDHGQARGFLPLTTGIVQASMNESRRMIGMAADVVGAQGVYWAKSGPLVIAMVYRDVRATTPDEASAPSAAGASDEPSPSLPLLLLSWLGSSLLTLAFGNYYAHPRVLKRSAPSPAGAHYRMLTAADETRVAPYLLEELVEMETTLARRGFATHRVTDQNAADITKLVVMFEHPTESTIGYFFLNVGQHTGVTRVTAFQTNFADGVEMYTTNSTSILRTPSRPAMDSVRFPTLATDALHDVHRARVADRAKTVAVAPLTRGPDPLAYEDRSARASQEYWVERGYRRWTSDGRLALTWRGAILSAWRALFPWKQITERSHARRRAEVVEKLGELVHW